ncbi:hypothetical protein F2Q69_00037673 [Brassica cretica]|uniref:Uncharacterized protein n=1 Tax=Brassica cretica TaxID=69181 RepID=A0A8S9SR87_BRACR|nr:hypothetical protein F2Q69_00037673 [Brassica cretica]
MSDDIGVRRNLRRNSACFLVVKELVAQNSYSGWRWREDGIWLAELMSLSSWIRGWDGVKNRHKFADENLIRFKALSRLASHAELEKKRVSLLGEN